MTTSTTLKIRSAVAKIAECNLKRSHNNKLGISYVVVGREIFVISYLNLLTLKTFSHKQEIKKT